MVDGQQRLITLTLLANAIYYEAYSRGRHALADRIQADFIRAIDYDSDDTDPRVKLSDSRDDKTFQSILDTGKIPRGIEKDTVSARIADSYDYLLRNLREDLAQDPFKRLGKWTKFLTDRLYFAVFVHPDASSAYQVYEVINTRGKELTTADLLKNYVISQTAAAKRESLYENWQTIQRRFADEGTNNFVQFIRHVVTVDAGHILPRDLFGFIAKRISFGGKEPPTVPALMRIMAERLPLYLQMIDPSIDGPAEPGALKIFSALNDLGVIAVRPLLLAIADAPDSSNGMDYILRLVVRRIIVGNLGTGNVERRFGEAARKINDTGSWKTIVGDLRDLNPPRSDFVRQLRTRSFNKGVLSFIRRSIIECSRTPERLGTLHFVWTRQAGHWDEMSEEEGAYWGATIGNTFGPRVLALGRISNSYSCPIQSQQSGAQPSKARKIGMLKLWRRWAKLWHTRPGKFGTMIDLNDRNVREAAILAVVDRDANLEAVNALMQAYKPETREVDVSHAALVIDSSAFLRLGPQADVIDYLRTRHAAPIILPGQSIQEFWNNNLSVADSIATGIKRKFEALEMESGRVDVSFQDFSERFALLLTEFRTSFGYAYDGGTVRRTISLLEVLRDKALTSYVRRERFAELAAHRKRTRTPPGFKDDGDGDFFVWLDMPDSLLAAKARNIRFDQVVLITNDKKPDWSREGIAHPLLSAEVRALTGVPFETWDVNKLDGSNWDLYTCLTHVSGSARVSPSAESSHAQALR